MYEGKFELMPGAVAAADVSAYKFRLLKLTGDNTHGPITSVSDIPSGVLQETAAAAGRSIGLAYEGFCKVEVGASVTAGDRLCTDNVGRVIPLVDGRVCVGRAVFGTSNAGEIIAALVDLKSPSKDNSVSKHGTAVNAVGATATLTFSGVVADGQTVTIGSRTYEFDTDDEVTSGNVKVDVSGGATASAAVTALVAAITADADAVVSAVDGTGDTVVCTAKIKGVSGNAIGVSESCTNGTWGDGVAALSGGTNGTVGSRDDILVDASYIYVCTADNTIAGANWKKAAIS